MGSKSPAKLARRAVSRLVKDLGLTGNFQKGFRGLSSPPGLTGINQTAIHIEVRGGEFDVIFGGFLGDPFERTYRGDDPNVLDKVKSDLASFNEDRVVVVP